MGSAPAEFMSSTPPSAPLLIQDAPQRWNRILRKLGPGLIIAASIVGSGELIATTKVGAEAGFALLWLIILGCVIKVFVQVEFGRFALSEGKTTLDALNMLPGPRLRANWLVWHWLLMFSFSIAQLGGIVGGVGSSLALTLPLTGDFVEQVDQLPELQRQQTAYKEQHEAMVARLASERGMSPEDAADNVEVLATVQEALGPQPVAPYTWDDVYWSALVTLITATLLVNGRYGLIQSVATVLVAGFTVVTAISVFGLQSQEKWAISWDELSYGLGFHLPAAQGALATALATFGIIGVGASELVAYPYWCLEKGYARFTGPRENTEAWLARAKGWLRVMQWDAWCSMLIYTCATVAFYLLGAAILNREGLNPAGSQMIRTLERMYSENALFGGHGSRVFLVGAFAVLYSTFFVATAANSRMAADALRVFKFVPQVEEKRRWWVRFFCAAFPFVSLSIYVWSKSPVKLVLLSGLMQALLLPMLGVAALFFRYRRCDPRIRPGRLWDTFLWISVVAFFIVGGVGIEKSGLLDYVVTLVQSAGSSS